ncbi:MAG: Trk family potassium uptake protein [Lachnospiraceae bacterium]|nr:Trk family potassium uptake protein [Lachnospiraceae bacterium]
MLRLPSGRKMSSFQIIICGFLAVILVGTLLLMLPFSTAKGHWASFETALFTSVSAVCVTGLVVQDTASFWSAFGQFVIMMLIQIGGFGIISVTAFLVTVSGRKISLLQRSLLMESISADQVGGIAKMTSFIFRLAFTVELIGAILMLPSFCISFGLSGIWMAVFHSVSAFCNAGFDVMGTHTGTFSSLTYFSDSFGVVLPICALIVIGGIGFLTWGDVAFHGIHFRRYRMQSKVIIVTTAILILFPTLFFFLNDFAAYPLKQRLCLSLFQAVTPRTAGFNTADMAAVTGVGRVMMIILMLIGGSPGSTAGGIKTTTAAVLLANVISTVRRRRNTQLFGRRIDDETVRQSATLLMIYPLFVLAAAQVISFIEDIPIGPCIFETASAIGTVGLSMGITPSLGTVSHLLLIMLMFFGRVGALTIMFAATSRDGFEVAQCPFAKIHVG